MFGRHRLGRGPRRRELLEAAAEFEARVRESDAALDASRDQVRKLEAELDVLVAEVGAFRAKELQHADARDAALRRAKELEETADAEARARLARAEEEAAKIRAGAHLQVEEVGLQIQQLLALKGKTLASVRAALSELDRSVGRVERGESGTIDESSAHEVEAATGALRERDPVTATRPALAAMTAGGPLQSGRVEIDAGPFADFGSLSAFERALARLPHVADVYVRRFRDERASIELTLSEATALVGAMRATLPYQLEIDDSGGETLRVTVVAALAATY